MIRCGALETERLVIRPFEAEDAAVLVALFADPAVARWVDGGEPLSLEEAELWVVRSRENLDLHGYGTGAVVERASGRLVGWAGYARPENGPEQIIYGLAAACWRRGFGREIVRGLVQFADERGMESVAATVHPANTHSATLLLEHGFRLVERGHGGHADADLYVRRAARL